MDGKGNLGEISLAVGEAFDRVDAVDIEMAVVHKGVIVAGVAAFPLERDGIAVAGIAIAHSIVRIELRLIGNAHRAVGVAGIDHVIAGVDGIAAVYIRKTGSRHGDRHHVLPVGAGIIRGSELPAVFVPGADMIIGIVVAIQKGNLCRTYIFNKVKKNGMKQAIRPASMSKNVEYRESYVL